MSLLLLLQGAQVVGDDRTFTASWEQAAATWDATMDTPVAGVTPRGPRLGAATVTGQAVGRRRRKRITFSASFIQRPASWRAEMDTNDDELAIAYLLSIRRH